MSTTHERDAAEDEPASKKSRSASILEQLKTYSVVVADTGEFESMRKFEPQDATTNPSLILKACMLPEYEGLVVSAIEHAKAHAVGVDAQLAVVMERLVVAFGVEISKIVPGYVSTEVDARLSFDTAATLEKARSIIALYASLGVDKSRILIKIAATYEGIRAAEILKAEGILCNLTLCFSLVQAAACAEAGIHLISPFVGRILDWYKAKNPSHAYTASDDPGVLSVKSIYRYFKKYGFATIVMGASFRNKEEIMALAGCDRLTIAPSLLKEMDESYDVLSRALEPASAAQEYAGGEEKLLVDEKSFRWQMNEDSMATEKLAEGIRGFAADTVKLEAIIRAKLTA